MPDYKKMYHKTFNALTDMEDLIQRSQTLMLRANALIVATQQQCEELYIEDKKETPYDDA